MAEEIREHATSDAIFICDIMINPLLGTSSGMISQAITWFYRFDANGYCRNSEQYGSASKGFKTLVHCRKELCNDYGKSRPYVIGATLKLETINATYSSLDDMPDCLSSPATNNTELEIASSTSETPFIPALIVVVAVIFAILACYVARIMRRRTLKHTEQGEHTELLKSCADTDIINPIDLHFTQHLPEHVIGMVNGNQVTLLTSVSNGIEFDQLRSNLTMSLAHDSCRMNFTQWTEGKFKSHLWKFFYLVY